MTESTDYPNKGWMTSDALTAGTFITMASTVIPDIVFHSGPNETRFTAKGMIYRGELVEDAGAAHAILMAVLNGRPIPEPAASSRALPPSIHAGSTSVDAINLARQALEAAQRSHGVQLASYPPQDPWMVNRVDEKIRAALKAIAIAAP